MANPQQPELARSRKTPALDPDATEAVLSAAETPTVDRARGPVPTDNQPGHHPAVEQDKPEAARFVAKVKEVAAEAEAEGEREVEPAVEVEPVVELEPVAAEPAPPPPSSRAEGLATLAGAPWKLAGDVLQSLRNRLG